MNTRNYTPGRMELLRVLSSGLLLFIFLFSPGTRVICEELACFTSLNGTSVSSIATESTSWSSPAKNRSTKIKRSKKIVLTMDETGRNRAEDTKFINQLKDELVKRGLEAVVSKYYSCPNEHIYTIKECPKDHWIALAAGGMCAGTFRDLVLGTKGKNGYLRSYWKKNNIQGLIIVNLTSYQLKNVSYLKRAHDDNFSPPSFHGLDKPYDYLIKNGFYVAESPVATKPVLSAKRAAVLAGEIARIVLGEDCSPDSEGSRDRKFNDISSSDSTTVLRRTEKNYSIHPEETKALQRALQENGYYLGCLIDGWFGPYTQIAVMEYQRDHGHRITGEVSRALYRELTGKNFN